LFYVLWAVFDAKEVQILQLISRGKVVYYFLPKTFFAAFWAVFLKTHLVTLITRCWAAQE
jgi:hypothetical protein